MTVGLETRPVHRACEKEDVCSFHSCAHRSFGPGSGPSEPRLCGFAPWRHVSAAAGWVWMTRGISDSRPVDTCVTGAVAPISGTVYIVP